MKKEETGKQIDLQVTLADLKDIVSGKKVEDYRSMSRYNINILTRSTAEWDFEPRTDIKRVRFVSGFKDVKFAICEINGIFIDEFVEFVPKGMKPGSEALTIEIRRVVKHNL